MLSDNGEAFAKIRPGLKKMLIDDLKIPFVTLQKEFGEVGKTVLDDFDHMFIVEELPDQKRDELRETMGDYVTEAIATLNGPIQTKLEEAQGKAVMKRKTSS